MSVSTGRERERKHDLLPRSEVMLAAADAVPDQGEEDHAAEDCRRVVPGVLRDRERLRHREDHDGEGDPGDRDGRNHRPEPAVQRERTGLIVHFGVVPEDELARDRDGVTRVEGDGTQGEDGVDCHV